MLFMISPWADSTDLACSVPDLDEQSCLEGKKAALGKEDFVLSSSACTWEGDCSISPG